MSQRYGKRALCIPAPWRFRELRKLPRGCPQRRAAAARIRMARNLRPLTAAEQKQRRIAQEALRRESLWTKYSAVGCVETGLLFPNAFAAAAHCRAVGAPCCHRSIVRSCNDGRAVSPARLRFLWLNGPRWPGAKRKAKEMRMGAAA